MRPAWLLAFAFLSALLSGCVVEEDPEVQGTAQELEAIAADDLPAVVAAIDDPQAIDPVLSAVAEVALAPGQDLGLRLGTGWGRLTVRAAGDLSFKPTLQHDDMALELFSDDGESTYGDGLQHTVVAAFPSDSDCPMCIENWRFDWWGVPGWGIWPHDTAETWGFDGIALKAGDTATVLVANTVPGYTLRLAGDTGNALEWRLDPAKAGHAVVIPDTQEELIGTQQAHASRDLRWEAPFPAQPESLLLSHGWDFVEGVGASAQLESGAFGCDGGALTPLDTPFPSYTVMTGGSSRSAGGSYGVVEAGDLECYRQLNLRGVDATQRTLGGSFLMIPM